MAADALKPVRGRFWRMLTVAFQSKPYASGSCLTGGRFNPKGVQALYLGSDHATAIAEFHQMLVRPGTLAGYDVVARRIADLTDPTVLARFGIKPEMLACEWRTISAIERRKPPSWNVADRLIELGAEGAIVPSFQYPAGRNLVLWHWRKYRAGGIGARLRLLDPQSELNA